MTEKDYRHRDVVDKLGIKPGHAVALDEDAWPLDPSLRDQILARTGRPPASEGEAVHVVVLTADAATDTVATLTTWKARLDSAGGIWMLTPKRGQPGHLGQRQLIPAGAAAGLVDNKSCSVSESVSAMRFVIRIRDRRGT